MKKRGKSKLFWWLGMIFLLFILLGTIPEFIVEWKWLKGVNYEEVFWTIRIARIMLFLSALVVALVYIGVNIRLMTKGMAPIRFRLATRMEMVDAPQEILLKAKHIKTFLFAIAGFISVLFAVAYYNQWDNYFRFRWAQTFDSVDPIFGNDMGFYIFRLPFIETVQTSLAVLAFTVTVIVTIFYFLSGAMYLERGRIMGTLIIGKRARGHIFANLGLWLLFLGWGYFLARYKLLYTPGNLIYGAGYTDVNVVLPVLWVLIVGTFLLAILAFIQLYRQKVNLLIYGGIILILAGVVGELFLPGIVQSYKVKPNELRLEEQYIISNIEGTRQAYSLDKIKVKKHNAKDTISYRELMEDKDIIKNIRLWDQNLIVRTYEQLQEIRLYYEFLDVDLDRYHTSEGYRQVLISGRELKTNLPPKAQTWVNKYLQYTHGYGAVMSPTTEKTEHGSPIFYLKDIPPVSDIGMEITRPALYYGESKADFKLVNTKIGEFHYPKGDENVYLHYDGEGGVPINSLMDRLLYAWKFGDINILLTEYLQPDSKIQFWRTIQERIEKIAPFLRLADDPYLVIDEGRLFWIQDAYTTTTHFPYSKPYKHQFNYIRNSVKIVVDAYHGSVDFYISDEEDPLIMVYKDLFPKMFQPMSTMPGNLINHIKYPKHLFEIQMELFSEYHMTRPQVFYNQEDLWERPTESYAGRKVRMRPYYVLSSLPGEDVLQYLLILPMTPKNRDNMISWATVKSDMPDYSEIIVYELPKERLFLGPAQMEAKIDQNTDISRDLSLWDQRGSQVLRGNLMIIPIKQSFLYVEPVFLISTDVNMPQLKRVIASTGSRVVMESTLDDALRALYDRKELDLPMLVDSIDLTPQILDSLGLKADSLLLPQMNFYMEEARDVWDDMKEALKKNEWKKFGEKMEELNQILERE